MTIMKNSTAVPQKIEILITINPAIPLMDIYLKELKEGSRSDVCTLMFIVTSTKFSQNVETTKLSINELNKIG